MDNILNGIGIQLPDLNNQTCMTIDAAIAQVQNQFLTIRPTAEAAAVLIQWQTRAAEIKDKCPSPVEPSVKTLNKSSNNILRNTLVILGLTVSVVLLVKLIKK